MYECKYPLDSKRFKFGMPKAKANTGLVIKLTREQLDPQDNGSGSPELTERVNQLVFLSL